MVATGVGNGQGVHGAFDKDGGGAGVEAFAVLGHAVQLLALGEQDGVAGVEVPRAHLRRRSGLAALELTALDVSWVEVVGVGVAAADEPDDLGAVGRRVLDGEHEAVADGVDEPAGRRAAAGWSRRRRPGRGRRGSRRGRASAGRSLG